MIQEGQSIFCRGKGMRCNKCGTESTTGRKFCAACGSRLSNRCPGCGAENAPSSAFCEDCGAALAGQKATAATRAPSSGSSVPDIRITPEQPGTSTTTDGERKTVTALFADIKGSTELMEDLDPEDARAMIDPALEADDGRGPSLRRLRRAIDRRRYLRAVRRAVAHEDHPQRALYAALRMQQEIRRSPSACAPRGVRRFQIRVGVNTGEVVVRSIQTGEQHVEYTPIGHTANLASRMQTLAEPGSVVVSEATFRLCEGYFLFRALGPSRVKGVSEPVNVYELTGLGSAAHAAAALGRPRALAIRRTRARDGRDAPRAGTGEEGPRADRRGDGRGRGRQVAAALRVQDDRGRAGA